MTPRQKLTIFLIVIFVVGFFAFGFMLRKKLSRPITLEIWGLEEKTETFSPLFDSFKANNPHISINYIEKSANNYHEDLLKAFALDKSPDIFMVLGSWLPYYRENIDPLDLKKDKELNPLLIDKLYPEAIKSELLENDFLLGMPLYVDTLALYCNRDIFNYHNIVLPPQAWEEIAKLVPKLRKLNPQGQITRAAIALGTSQNVNWETDIVSVLMMQQGAKIVDKENKKAVFDESLIVGEKRTNPGEEALKFYLQFANPRSPNYTWSDSFENSILAFAKGKTAMMIGYNRAKKLINEYAPDLRYEISFLPNFAGNLKINYARTMNFVVSKRSNYKKEAWQLLKFVNQKENAEYYFLKTKNPPSRLDIAQNYINDRESGVFVKQIQTGRNWHQADFIKISQIFREMIDSAVIRNIAPAQAVSEAVKRINLIWQTI